MNKFGVKLKMDYNENNIIICVKMRDASLITILLL